MSVLRPSLFSPWRDDASTANLVDVDTPEELQKKDPLGIQIWRLYSKTKNSLPNQERMGNLSWRMMSMNLKKQQEEHTRLVPHCLPLVVDHDSHTRNSRLNERRVSATPMATSKPSGIAQLRQQSSANEQAAQHDHMNMDDFILPNSVASPANISRSPSVEKNFGPGGAIASAIPIKKQNELRDQSFPHSLPLQAPLQSNMSGEFGYVQRHVRKTSIDERRVSTA